MLQNDEALYYGKPHCYITQSDSCDWFFKQVYIIKTAIGYLAWYYYFA